MPHISSPFLSVIMPTYNGERYLAKALGSLCDQELKNFEVIIVDDGSSDSTLKIAEQFSNKLDLKIIREKHSGLWTHSTTIGMKRASGKYLSVLHQDDFWLPSRCRKLFEAVNEHSEPEVIAHPSCFVDANDTVVGRWRCPLPVGKALIESSEILEKLIVQNFIAMPAVIWKRDNISNVNSFDNALWFTADWKFWLSLAQGGAWHYINEPLTCFRLHSESQTVTGGRSAQDYREQYEAVLDQFLPAALENCQNPKRLQRSARLSVEVNMYLLSKVRGWHARLFSVLRTALASGAPGIMDYLTYSRIVERLWPRIRVQQKYGRWEPMKGRVQTQHTW